MKKLISIAIAIVLFLSSTALAEIDLDSMSYEELAALRDRCQAELMTRPEWQQITVPSGDYRVGVDIPAGEYTILPTPDGYSNVIVWKGEPDDYRAGFSLNESVTDYNQKTVWRAVLRDGYTLSVGGSAVILTPYRGLGL